MRINIETCQDIELLRKEALRMQEVNISLVEELEYLRDKSKKE